MIRWSFRFGLRLSLGFAVLGQASESYPAAASKKGLQVEMVEDALELGVKHAALNFSLTSLATLTGGEHDPQFKAGDRIVYLRTAYLEQMDRQIKSLSDRGVIVNLIVLTYQSPEPEINRLLLHPGYDSRAPNRLGAFNTSTDLGRECFRSIMESVASRWSRPDQKFGQVCGYIMGNEVNSHWFWSNQGEASMEEFADDYERTVRLAHVSVRKYSPWARVYVSLEHHWNIRYPAGSDRQCFPGRLFLDYFARRVQRNGDFEWHLAFHPYPENLFEPRFWNDRSANSTETTPRITFKNLEVLSAYLSRPELRYQGRARRIILSEQGFHTPAGPDGERIQAAAYCYAYKKVEGCSGIDAFILHRHVDHAAEGGLLLGLRRNQPADGQSRPKKLIYECFRAADTPEWERVFAFALPIIGLTNWNGAIANCGAASP